MKTLAKWPIVIALLPVTLIWFVVWYVMGLGCWLAIESERPKASSYFKFFVLLDRDAVKDIIL